MRHLGVEIDKSSMVFSGARIVGHGKLRIGAGAFINHGCVLDCGADITIGRNAALGNEVMLLTSHHQMADPARRAGPRQLLPIVIGDGAWLGARVVVLAGVTIGAGAVVGAGSVVTRDCKPHHLYLGSPAREVRPLAGAGTQGNGHGRARKRALAGLDTPA